MLYYWGALVVCGLLYTYRYRVLFMTIRVVVKIMQLYKQLQMRNIKQNHLQFVTAEELSDNVVVCHYHGYIDKKEHKLKVIKNALCHHYADEIIDHIIDSLDLKNHIVHCSLITPDNKILDLTSVIREFVYHFDKDDEWSRMEHFLKYVTDCYGGDLEELGIDTNDMYFVVYLNDETFTEIKYKVEDITKHQFKDVLRIGRRGIN